VESALDGSLRLIAKSGVALESAALSESVAIARALRQLLRLHITRTGSARARWLLDDWEHQHARWRKVKPRGAAEHVTRIRATWGERLELLAAAGSAAAVAG